MAFQFSVAFRTDEAAALAARLAGGALKLFSAAEPANCAAADPAGLLATGALPGTAATAALGVMTKAGAWTVTGSAAGSAVSYRLYDSAAVCHNQGTVTITGGGGDMTVDNPSIAPAQVITIGTFQVTFGNP